MKNPRNKSTRFTRCQGISLVELMTGLAISTVIVVASLDFMIEATRSTLRTQNNSRNDLTEWGIYTGITIDTRTANGMTLFKDFTPSSFNDPTDEIGSPTSLTGTLRGDFLVLTKSSQPDNNTPSKFLSLTGYVYQAGATAGTGTFQRFTYTVPTAEQGNTLETILTAHYASFIFITVASGLDATISDHAPSPATPQNRAFLFRDYTLRSAVLNLQVSQGYSGTHTDNTKLIETAFYIRN